MRITVIDNRGGEVIKLDEKQTTSIMGDNTTDGRMNISPFNVYIRVNRDTVVNKDNIDLLNSYVIMKDRTEYYLTGNR